jgi:hypothetical protein
MWDKSGQDNESGERGEKNRKRRKKFNVKPQTNISFWLI